MRPLSSALPGALAELLRDTTLSPGKVAFAWRAAVGPAIEQATEVKLEGGILLVETTSPQWAREVRRSSPIMLGRLQSLLGTNTVTGIQVRGHRGSNPER